MKTGEAATRLWLAIKNTRLEPKPFGGYEDIGAVFILAVLLGLILRLLARIHFLPRSAMVIFALFHGPTDLVHWVTLTGTGIGYGWMRVASGSTTAPALMHATYNLTLCLLAGA